jgi:hypothetical protein
MTGRTEKAAHSLINQLTLFQLRGGGSHFHPLSVYIIQNQRRLFQEINGLIRTIPHFP